MPLSVSCYTLHCRDKEQIAARRRWRKLLIDYLESYEFHLRVMPVCLCVQPLKDEGNKETELSKTAPKEVEHLGRLHFTLDYNFTDNTVRCGSSRWHDFVHHTPGVKGHLLIFSLCQWATFSSLVISPCWNILAGSRHHPSCRTTCNGCGR